MVHDRPINCVCITWLTMAGCYLFQQHCVSLFKLRQERVHTVCFQCVCVCVCLTIRETVLAYACAWVYRRECNNCLRLIPKCDELSVRVKSFSTQPYFLSCTIPLLCLCSIVALCVCCASLCAILISQWPTSVNCMRCQYQLLHVLEREKLPHKDIFTGGLFSLVEWVLRPATKKCYAVEETGLPGNLSS